MTRDKLLDTLLTLNLAQLEILRARLRVPENILPSGTASPAQRAIAILEHQELQEQGLSKLEGALGRAQQQYKRDDAQVGQIYSSETIPLSLGNGFYGRSDWLSSLREALLKNAVALASLEASGGMGKTRVAIEYIYTFRKHYLGGIFWVNAEHIGSQTEQFYRLLEALDPKIPSLAELLRQDQNVAHLLSKTVKAQDGEKLWVIDNIPEAKPKSSPVSPERWCPVWGQVSVLITSRRKITHPSVVSIELPPLADEPARQFLTHELSQSPLKENVDAVVNWVGGLPLALELLAGGLSLGALSWNHLMVLARGEQDVATQLDDTMDALRGEVPKGQLRGVTEALMVSFDALDKETKELACVLAQFGPDPIPEPLIDALEQGSRKARVQLKSRHFLTGELFGIAGQIHRVVSSFLRAQGRRGDWGTAEKAVLDVMTADACRDPKCWSVMDGYAPHARTLISRGELAQANCVELLLRLGSLEQEKGLLMAALETNQKAFKYAIEHFGEEHPQTLVAMGNFALTLSKQGKLERAFKLETSLLGLRQRVLDSGHPDTLVSMNNIASNLLRQGKFGESLVYGQEVLELRRKMLGYEDSKTLNSMSNYAAALTGLERHQDALKIYKELCDLMGKVYGPEHPHTLQVRSNKAITLWKQMRYQEALAIEQEVLDIRLRVLGDEHTDTSVSQFNLMKTHLILGEKPSAKKLLNDLQWLKNANLELLSGSQKDILTNIQDPRLLAEFENV